MSLPLDGYRCKLINEILLAGSQYEVKRCIDAAMDGLKKNKINGHIIARFTEKVILDLHKFNPMDKDAQQWSNIVMARIHFKQINASNLSIGY
jgi:hypothetical protein